MEVKLTDEYQEELKNNVKQLINRAVEEVQRQTAINSPWIKGRKNTCKWLNVSNQTLNKLIQLGMPVHYVDGLENVAFFNKKELTEFLLKQ